MTTPAQPEQQPAPANPPQDPPKPKKWTDKVHTKSQSQADGLVEVAKLIMADDHREIDRLKSALSMTEAEQQQEALNGRR